MKIVIVNQHKDNRGDEAAGRAVIDSLLKEFPDATIDVIYKAEIPGLPVGPVNERVKHYQNDLLINDVILTKKLINFKKLKLLMKILRGADLVVNAPTGPNIGDIYKDIRYMAVLTIAILLGKKTCIYGSSFGPFKVTWFRLWSRFVLENMLFMCARDEISYKHLKNLKLKNKHIYLSLDAVVQRKIDYNDVDSIFEELNLSRDKKYIGLTALINRTRHIKGTHVGQLKIIQNLVDIMDNLIENHDYEFILIPHLYVHPDYVTENFDDMHLLYSIRGRLKNPLKAHVISNKYDSDIQQKLLGNTDFNIAMRYHTAVFSCKAAVPPLCIPYQYKAKAFMEMLGLKDLVVDLREFINDKTKAEKIIEKIMENRSDYSDILNKKMPELMEISGTGTKLIRELYYDKR